jgi:SAM-dependent methyltransferase
MARAGHTVTAIDPQAPEGPIFRRLRIEEFSDPDPFGHVVAILSLHHVEDLGSALDKIAYLLRAGGTLIVVETAWGRFDEATAEWAFERLCAAPSSGEPSWLQRCCREWARGRQERARAPAEAHLARRASEEGLHSSRRMHNELGRRFDECLFEWVPYLYPDLDDDTSEADECAAIEAGVINVTGFLYVGTAR